MKNNPIPFPEIRILLFEFCQPIATDIGQFCEKFVESAKIDLSDDEYRRLKHSIDWAMSNDGYDFRSLVANPDKTNQQILSMIQRVSSHMNSTTPK